MLIYILEGGPWGELQELCLFYLCLSYFINYLQNEGCRWYWDDSENFGNGLQWTICIYIYMQWMQMILWLQWSISIFVRSVHHIEYSSHDNLYTWSLEVSSIGLSNLQFDPVIKRALFNPRAVFLKGAVYWTLQSWTSIWYRFVHVYTG